MNQLDDDEFIVFTINLRKKAFDTMMKPWQARVLMLTTKKLYNVKDRQHFQRAVEISRITFLTKCVDKGSGLFGLHVEDEYDYLL